jgi:CheY-like chemotaxis protein
VPKRVLIIDDDMAISLAMSVRLKAAGYKVDLASSGQAGLDQAANHRPDVIILDIRMPEIDGYEVCRRLKVAPDLVDIPVIFVSANATETTRQKTFEVGGFGFIAKPYEPKDILDVIQSATTV